MNRQPLSERVFVGGGEMGDRMRAFDWEATPLGPVERWPQSLRSAVSILLPSKAEIVLFWGPDLITLYNDAYRPVLGAKHPWALGQPARECWREVWGVLQPLFEGVMRTGEAFWAKDHLFLLERHGFPEETYFDVSYDPVRDESGGVGGVFCIVSETTGRVLGERRLRLLRELGAGGAAKSDADVYAQAAIVLAQTPADIPFALFYGLDRGGSTAHLVERVGVAPDALTIGDVVDLGSTRPGATAFREAMRTGRAVEAHPDDVVNTVPGPASPQRLLVLPLLSGTQPAGILVAGLSRHLALEGHYRDFFDLVASRLSTAIGSVRAYEEEHRRAQALAELDQAKTAFFSNVSHEFRTPLTLLLGPLEDLSRPATGLALEDRERVDIAHRNANRLLKLVNTLLDFSRLEAGRIKASYEPTDVGAYTADLASAFRSLVERAGLRLVVDCPGGLDAYVDREMWEKVVSNLLSNAFKYTLAGEIRVRVRHDAGRLTLSVSDTGTGIAPGELPHVFERFHRVQNARARTQEGTGIGLALVAEIVKLHGGTIDVVSELDRGSTFTVSLPLGCDHLPAGRVGARWPLASTALGATPFVHEAARWGLLDDGVGGEVAIDPGPPGRDGAPSARVLLADDNADMREYVRRLLGRYWTVDAQVDGAAALASARRRVPDLVLTDVMMPGLNGFELLRALRADPSTRTVPVILLSARAGEESRVEGLEAGADDYLIKPFAARELIARVAAHLELARVRREAAERERQARTEADRARALLEDFFDNAPIALHWVGPDGVVLRVNQAELDLLGYAREDFVGRPVTDFHVDRAVIDDILRRLAAGEVIRNHESRMRCKDGAIKHVLIDSNVLRGPAGEFVHTRCFTRDVTDLERAEQQRLQLLASERAARAELEAANRSKDQFLAMLSHELRTPLNAMVGWTRMLLSGRLDESSTQRALQAIGRSTQTQAQLIDDLLDVSKIITGKLHVDLRPTQLRPAIEAALESVAEAAARKGLAIESSFDTGAPTVLGDETRLRQIVTNLVVNAVKFTPEGGRISVRLEQDDREAVVTVSDSGIGISAEDLPRIFGRFHQASRSSQAISGLGLGLAIVDHLVRQHQGRIIATSEGLGRGARFTVRLPLAEVDDVADAAPRRPAHGLVDLRDLAILVVEDDQDGRELVAEMLRSQGARVTAIESAEEALREVARSAPAVLLSDIGLSGMDGYTLLRRIRALPGPAARIPAIALTAYARPEDRRLALAAGFQRHISKPIEPHLLCAIVAELADAKAAAARDHRDGDAP